MQVMHYTDMVPPYLSDGTKETNFRDNSFSFNKAYTWTQEPQVIIFLFNLKLFLKVKLFFNLQFLIFFYLIITVKIISITNFSHCWLESNNFDALLS